MRLNPCENELTVLISERHRVSDQFDFPELRARFMSISEASELYFFRKLIKSIVILTVLAVFLPTLKESELMWTILGLAIVMPGCYEYRIVRKARALN